MSETPQFFPIDFFVVGVQKCATSWMYYCLRDHPEIRTPKDKRETHYIGGEPFQKNGAAWYFDRYPPSHGEQMTGEVSVEYFYDPQAPENIQPYVEQPKFIVSLRHPVDRLISAYFWNLRKKFIPNQSIEKGLEQLLHQEAGFPTTLESAPLEDMVRRGCYAEQLRRYLKMFPPENFLVLLYEEIQQNQLQSIQRVYNFLGVQADFVPPSLEMRPKKNSYNKFLLSFERVSRTKLIAKLADIANQFLTKFVHTDSGLTPTTREQLDILFRPQIEDLKKELTQLPTPNRPSDKVLQALWSLS